MSSLTTRAKLYKPADDGSENVNVSTDLNANWDRIDSLLGIVTATSGTRPASTYSGLAIRETDTKKVLIHDGTGWNVQLLSSSATFVGNLDITGGYTGTGQVEIVRTTASSDQILRSRITTDTNHRFSIVASGLMEWGPGGSASRDTNLYRVSANILKTDDSFSVGTDLTVTSSASVGGSLTVGGRLDAADGLLMTQLLRAQCSSALSLTTALTDVPGMTSTFTTLYAGATVEITWVIDYNQINTTSSLGLTQLSIDGSDIGAPQNICVFTTNGQRAMCYQVYTTTLASAGSHTIKVRGQRTTGADGNIRINSLHSQLVIKVFE